MERPMDIRPSPPQRKDRSLERSLERTLDLRSTPPPAERRVWSRNNSREKLETLPDRRSPPPLDWTQPPSTSIEEDPIGVRYQVSVPSTSGARFHKPHLKQTFRLDPCRQGKPPLPPPVGRKTEQIVVKEADLRRFGHDIKLLREVQLQPQIPGEAGESPPPAPTTGFELSFKSAFAERCRAGADVRDPWQGLQNPEFSREHSESDLVLNQVWVNAIPARRPSRIPLPIDEGGEEEQEEGQPEGTYATEGEEAPESAASGPRSASAGPKLERQSSKRVGDRERRSARMRGTASEPGPRPASEGPATERRAPAKRRGRSRSTVAETERPSQQTTPVQSRIQPLSDVLDDDEDAENCVGSQAVRAAIKTQRSGLRKLNAQLHYDNMPRAAWLSLDMHTGELAFYEKAAAERLESAFRNGRQSVPLAGLGKELDGSIVSFARNDEGKKTLETTLKGRQREVQRIPVPAELTEIRVNVVRQDGRWQLISEQAKQEVIRAAEGDGVKPPKMEERRLQLTGGEVANPPVQLPPVNRNERTYFINQSFCEYW